MNSESFRPSSILAPALVSLWGAVWLAACGDATGSLSQLDLAVSVSEAVITLDDAVTITVTVTNPTDGPVSLGDQCVPVGFRVRDTQGTRVSPMAGWESGFFCIGEIDNVVPPHGAKPYGFQWSPLRDYGSVDATPLPPGDYEVVGGLAGEPLRPPMSAPAAIRLEAP